jgi:hypothetical protein
VVVSQGESTSLVLKRIQDKSQSWPPKGILIYKEKSSGQNQNQNQTHNQTHN